jgi:hypothetical protein
MSPNDHDWRIAVMQAHERLFDPSPGELENALGYPLCDTGWQDILERLCIRVAAALQDGETFNFVRIRQKFGILGVDWHGEMSEETRAKVLNAIDLAHARSACICESCGIGGRLFNNHGWLATRCTEHALGDPASIKQGFENIRILRRVPGESGLLYAHYDRETDTLTEVSPKSLGLRE